jgi:hypothetical protein
MEKLNNEEFNALYSSPNTEKNEMGGAYGVYVGGERCIQVFRGET